SNSSAHKSPSTSTIILTRSTKKAKERKCHNENAEVRGQNAELSYGMVLVYFCTLTSDFSRLISYACATRRIVASSKCLPKICNPIGKFSRVSPQGTEIPGMPARSEVTV